MLKYNTLNYERVGSPSPFSIIFSEPVTNVFCLKMGRYTSIEFMTEKIN
jgi:hypothetical protein